VAGKLVLVGDVCGQCAPTAFGDGCVVYAEPVDFMTAFVVGCPNLLNEDIGD